MATAVCLSFSCVMPVSALTVRTKADLRLWETVTTPSTPLSWIWEDAADSARLSFSNRLTRTVSTVVINRAPDDMHGSCPHPVSSGTEGDLVVATLVQYAAGAEIARETAELAYVPGAAGRALTVRAKSDGAWHRVKSPRIAAFDAGWWNVSGPSGYEVVWSQAWGTHRHVRAFDGVGIVDEVDLLFIESFFRLLIR